MAMCALNQDTELNAGLGRIGVWKDVTIGMGRRVIGKKLSTHTGNRVTRLSLKCDFGVW